MFQPLTMIKTSFNNNINNQINHHFNFNEATPMPRSPPAQ